MDVLFDGKKVRIYSSRRVDGVSTHGTGCTYSAAIAAGLAAGKSLSDSVAAAKRFITQAIAGSYRIRRHFALNHGAKR